MAAVMPRGRRAPGLEYRLLTYRRTYDRRCSGRSCRPVLFLAAMGLGLGTYVNESGSAAPSAG